MNRAVFVSLSILCLFSVSSIAGFIQVVKADSGTIYIRADGSIDPPTALISTIDNVTYTFTGNISVPGDLLDGIVIERDNIVLNGAGYTVQGTGRIWPGFGMNLTGRSNVTIKNANIYHFSKGIYLVNSSNNIVGGNNVTVIDYGIDLQSSSNNIVSGNKATGNIGAGIELGSSSYNTVSGNTATANRHSGIELVSSSNNIVSGNDATANWDCGISLGYSSNNTVSGNNATEEACGINLWCSSYNTVSGNNASVTSLDGIFLAYSSNNNIVSGNNVSASGRDGIHLIKSSYNVVSGNNASANGNDGIHLYLSSNNNTVSGNGASANAIGIALEDGSYNNTVSGNMVTANGFAVRICLWSPSNNSIYHNNFIGNAFQASSDGSPNMWDNGYSSGGNYWSDYNGTDLHSGLYQNVTGSDGIGDTPYVIDANNMDGYPLMGGFSDFNVAWGVDVQVMSNSTVSCFQFNGTAILFNVSGANGTTGFCNVCVPTTLLNGTLTVLVNGTQVQYNLLPISNSTNSYLHFTYNHSTEQVIIMPEFPSSLFVALFIVASLLAVIVYKKRGMKRRQSWRE